MTFNVRGLDEFKVLANERDELLAALKAMLGAIAMSVEAMNAGVARMPEFEKARALIARIEGRE
jgi:dsRNA-specific ribonuclease